MQQRRTHITVAAGLHCDTTVIIPEKAQPYTNTPYIFSKVAPLLKVVTDVQGTSVTIVTAKWKATLALTVVHNFVCKLENLLLATQQIQVQDAKIKQTYRHKPAN